MTGSDVSDRDEMLGALTHYTDQSISTIHHSLRASRRRLVIGLIGHRTITATTFGANPTDITSFDSETESVVAVRQLAREIVAIEENIPLEHATGEPYHNVYTALIQTHLPELDDVGAITYDSDRKTVAPAQNLVVLAMVAAIMLPVSKMLFYGAAADFYSMGVPQVDDSIND